MIPTTLLMAVRVLGIFVGLVFTLMMGAGLLASLWYSTKRSNDRAENVRLVIPTIASENVRSALLETIDHTLDMFPEYELYCVVDKGSDLEDELVDRGDISTVVVPDAYECNALAKGRAMNYFIETVVTESPNYWYGFIDDDNRILDDAFLYEIPHYEARGYRAMNPVLVPRPGQSLVTFMADHIRFVDDIALYRLFTGVIGTPYLGFHGELLCARGDVLIDIGFDRETIVEDFAFALELVDSDIPVWQSSTRISVLSPHDVISFLKQRSRWYLGITRYLPNAPLVSKLVVGFRIATWSAAVTSSWLLLPVWFIEKNIVLPEWFLAFLGLGSLIYIATIGLGAWRIGGLKGLIYFVFTPIYATLEHIVPLYALWSRESGFVVIDK